MIMLMIQHLLNAIHSEPKIVYDCGMKYNILRTLVQTHQVELAIVSFDYDLEKNPSNLQWERLFYLMGQGIQTCVHRR